MIAIVANSDVDLFRFRAPLLKTLVELGVKVFAVVPPGSASNRIEALGAIVVPWELDRRSINPFTELRSLAQLTGIYMRLQPDLAHHYTVKPNIYGALAARIAGVPLSICSITGLGYAFTPGSAHRTTLRWFLSLMYRLCAVLSDRLTFLTQYDLVQVLGSKQRFQDKARVTSGGEGVDLRVFSPNAVTEARLAALREEIGAPEESLVVTMASRLLWDKGVAEYAEAARQLKRSLPGVLFLLAGTPDSGNPDSVAHADVERWCEEGIVQPIGHIEDMPALFAMSDVVVLPSYAEGVPRVLLEAAAMARPIVGTAIPGVRAIVEHEINGLLVPVRDESSLAQAVERLLDSEDLRLQYGAAGRAKVEKEFDDRIVAEWFIEEYRSLWKAKRGSSRRT